MKVTELFEDRYFDQWAKDKAAENRAKLKKVKDAERADRDLHDKAVKAYRAQTRPTKPTDVQIWQKAYTVVGNAFPDGDPIDQLGPYLDRNGLTMKDLDRAIRKHEGVKGGYYAWLRNMWDDVAADAVHDAKADLAKGLDPETNGGSPFYHVENGKVVPAQNPWK